MRTLADLATLAPEVARALGAEAAFALAGGKWPAAALAFDGQGLLLLRDHGFAVSLSLPSEEHSWSISTREELVSALPQIASTLAAYRAQHPKIVSLVDVMVAIAPTLAHLPGSSWLTNFPGTPVPSEAWLESDGRSVGLFQEGSAVVVVVWVSGKMRSKTLSDPGQVAQLAPWLAQQIAAQAQANVQDALAAAELAERKRALPPVLLSDVLAALRAGARFRVGGGRYSITYFMAGAQLQREEFDEGHVEVSSCSEAELAAALQRDPDDFRR